jgi:hypothetical protein
MKITLAQKAEKFAYDKHKGLYGTKPYTHHLKMVIDELFEVIHLIPMQHQDAVIAAAWLHDIMEDEKINNAVLEDEFGKEVAELVWLLTNHTGKRASPEYYEKLKSDPYATIIKLCDRIANVKYSLEGKERIPLRESFVPKIEEQKQCKEKFAMYKSENDVFVAQLNKINWIQNSKLDSESDYDAVSLAISTLSLKLVHLFNQPQLTTQNVRKLDITVKFFDHGSSSVAPNLNENDFTTNEIMDALKLIVISFSGIISEQISKQKNKENEHTAN